MVGTAYSRTEVPVPALSVGALLALPLSRRLSKYTAILKLVIFSLMCYLQYVGTCSLYNLFWFNGS